MWQLEPDIGDIRPISRRVLAANRVDRTGMRIPGLKLTVATKGHITLSQIGIEVRQEI